MQSFDRREHAELELRRRLEGDAALDFVPDQVIRGIPSAHEKRKGVFPTGSILSVTSASASSPPSPRTPLNGPR